MGIGDNIKQYRNKKGITQSELGNLIGKKEITVRKYENGGINPNIKVLTNIASALGVDLSVLLQNTNYKEITDTSKEDLDFLVEDYSKYRETFNQLGYKVIRHTGTYLHGNQNEGLIYDILLNDKLIITLALDGFCKLGEKLLQYKQSYDRGLVLLINDTISNWKIIYEISENDDNLEQPIITDNEKGGS